MKRFKKKVNVLHLCIAVIALLIAGGLTAYAAFQSYDQTAYEPSDRFVDLDPWFRLGFGDSYISPVNPFDTPEKWAGYEGTIERLAESQIPETLLRKMSTEGLAVSCLNYNYLGDLFLPISPQDGFNALAATYNGLCELVTRKDSGKALLSLYHSVDLNELYKEDRYSTLRLGYLEIILAQRSVLSTLADDEIAALIEECVKTINIAITDMKGTYNPFTTLFLAVRCLEKTDPFIREMIKDFPVLQSYVDTGILRLDDIPDDCLEKIVTHLFNKYGRVIDK